LPHEPLVGSLWVPLWGAISVCMYVCIISMHLLVSKAIAVFLQKAWGIRNAYKHGNHSCMLMFLSPPASERRGADVIEAWYHPSNEWCGQCYVLTRSIYWRFEDPSG
jgi:hypothetical protein